MQRLGRLIPDTSLNSLVVNLGSEQVGFLDCCGFGGVNKICDTIRKSTDVFLDGHVRSLDLVGTYDTQLLETGSETSIVSLLLLDTPELILQLLAFVGRTELVHHDRFQFLPRQLVCSVVPALVPFCGPPVQSSRLEDTGSIESTEVIWASALTKGNFHRVKPMKQRRRAIFTGKLFWPTCLELFEAKSSFVGVFGRDSSGFLR
ncbi:hypothetical protein HanIR_Chr01g0036121 [Helianthus annuus]|nr:hypothetical protein HanIR_Chr01g0036121 [Helianthus annuus]